MSLKFFSAWLATMLFLVSLEAHATRKTDVVTLYNGDQLTGEIKSLFGSILEFSTSAMGTVRIEWPEIASISSEYRYEVRLSDGERLYGSLDKGEREGQAVLIDPFERHELEWLQVIELRPIQDSFAERLDVYLAAGYSYTKASSVGQLSFNTEVSYEDESSRNLLRARTEITTTKEDDTSATRVDVYRDVWRENRADAFRAIFANYEDNDELELAYRLGAGAGLGRYFIDNHRRRLYGVAGMQVITEKPLDSSDSNADTSTNQDIELLLNVNYAVWQFSTPELNLDLGFTLYPSLTDSGRVRSNANLRLRWELIDDLYWDFTAWSSTDNAAENSGKSRDYSLTTGIGWEY
ncbi:hypothetical protein GCM10007052_11760 [Halioglobus japonicus]|uniref:DUF481 domain-containing protein n=1 Tax=Halioglobus japonicus TaxID=930805 RepID=A0AAP8MF43_9GAMM|nr:DUF481 domain-containing protein [Halioglobus japonicus]PLW86661.1 DUF481 domain-containing protein [Halioglobus japonicus]GHD11706.1 hypothetical protein GCM10007052_11760 [Halioglobus japonicus]